MVEAYNNIIDKRFEDALRRFGQLTFLPLKKGDEPLDMANIFGNLNFNIKSILFEVIVMIGKCIEIVYNIIKRETR